MKSKGKSTDGEGARIDGNIERCMERQRKPGEMREEINLIR